MNGAESVQSIGGMEKISRSLPVLFAGVVLANLVYVVDVLVFSWDVFRILALLWVENCVLGVFCLFRIFLARRTAFLFRIKAGVFLAVGLTMQQMAFGAAAMVFFCNDFVEGDPETAHRIMEGLKTDPHLIGSAVFLFAIHGYDFVSRFLVGGDWKTATSEWQLRHVMIRMPLMIVAILVGGAALRESPLLAANGGAIAGLLLLIAIKTAIEAYFAWQERPANL